MTRPEELQILRTLPHHYLWYKQRKEWTEQDKINLINPQPEHNYQKREYTPRGKAKKSIEIN